MPRKKVQANSAKTLTVQEPDWLYKARYQVGLAVAVAGASISNFGVACVRLGAQIGSVEKAKAEKAVAKVRKAAEAKAAAQEAPAT